MPKYIFDGQVEKDLRLEVDAPSFVQAYAIAKGTPASAWYQEKDEIRIHHCVRPDKNLDGWVDEDDDNVEWSKQDNEYETN